MEGESTDDGNKKRNYATIADDDEQDSVLSEPDAKRAKLVERLYCASQSSSEDDEIPNETASWWRKFYNVPSHLHIDTIMMNEETFLKTVLPPIDPKWNDKVMYAMSYVGCRSTSLWTHFECVTKEEDKAIKAFIANDPDFEIGLGSLEGKHSDVRMRWVDVVKWESSDPRVLQEHKPVQNDYTEQLLRRAIPSDSEDEDDEDDRDDEEEENFIQSTATLQE